MPSSVSHINYITNLSVEKSSGGWSGMNYHVYHQLRRNASINVIQSIDPEYSFFVKAFSKIKRQIGIPGIFPAFTQERLQKISALVDAKIDPKASLNFFHGSTPWLSFRSGLPYALYLDACFATYMEVYHDKRQFSTRQLNELYKKEASFLNEAGAVFFSSRWALHDARNRYGIEGANFHVAGLGGHLDLDNLPRTGVDEFSDPFFLFVGLDFFGKGGHIVVSAFEKLRQQFPLYSLKIVGQKPPDAYLNRPGVEYLGVIDKSKPREFQQLASLFSCAVCFLLPTSKDITPLVLIEAGSVGCPVVSVKKFGIPEIVRHSVTGILLDLNGNPEEELLQAMLKICRDPSSLQNMRKEARKHIEENFTWNKTGEYICKTLNLISD
jgi:glycosyltransferase involved in cell wall biosynthesis